MNANTQTANILPALHKRGIGRKLLLLIILFSSFVTLVSTSIQLYIDYKREVNTIQTRLDEVESAYLGSISSSLWNLDTHQLFLLLEGIRHLPDIKAVVLHESADRVSNPLMMVQGEPSEHRVIIREYPIIYSLTNQARVIGKLTIYASLHEVYQRLWEKAVVILLTQGVKTFLVSMFILFIFFRLVTQHLSHIARFVSRFELSKSSDNLALERRPPREADELDQVTTAFNTMTYNLRQAYDDLQKVNVELELDIIARKKAEEEVKHLNSVLEERVLQRTAELEAANKELASFCYSVSHDLRAPLRRIEGFRRILMDEYSSQIDDNGQHYLNRIAAGTHEMADMIDSFLRLSRATQGELKVERTDLSRVAHHIMQRLHERDPERKLVLKIADHVEAKVDPRLFDLALTNLLDNAWKYSRNRSQTEIHFAQNQEAGYSVYSVSDNGAGFDMKHAERLFSPFSRLHKAEEFDGVGIGLATVQRIIARHGGRIWAESAPDQGATFYFTLWERNTDRDQEGNHPAGRRQSR